jgi:transketolase
MYMATTTTPTFGYDDLPALLTRLTGDEKHDRSSFSTLDVLWVLYDRVLGENDRFILSKGHGPAALYAVLAAKGIVPLEALDGFGSFDSPLGYHPDRNRAPGVEFSSGSLGHGLGVATGVALTGRRVWCLVGDGELDEGSNWEAVQYAGRMALGSMTAVVITTTPPFTAGPTE